MFRIVNAALFMLFSALSTGAETLPPLQESTFWAQEVNSGNLPAVADRLPAVPLIVDLTEKGRTYGVQGGTLRTLVSRSKDVRQMVVYGYARLVGYDHNYQIKPDILQDVEVEEGRKFTLRLRPGHRWSDGHPFTSADFEYYWKYVALNEELSPSGPSQNFYVDGELAKLSFPDPHTVVIEWSKANPNFLPLLAQASPFYIFRPAHYLKQFHAEFTDKKKLKKSIKKARVRTWAALHNGKDNMYKFDNPELPTLQPWMNASKAESTRKLFVRNPFYHRVDKRGQQLPYIDVVEMTIVGGGLIAAKANAGEVDLQARGLNFPDISILKKGEADGSNYRTLLWSNGAASQIAIYPNLNFADPVWRDIIRDVRFRRALSMGIDRRMINRALYFGLAKEGGMSALEASPFHDTANLFRWSVYYPAKSNALLDEMGLSERTPDGIRKLPDGRPMEFVIETAGERKEVENALAIVTDTWREIGIKLIMRPLDRDILRNRVYSGLSMGAVWFGWDNGLPQHDTSPEYLAPKHQEFFAWPKWGQYFQTGGEVGEAPDLPEAQRLMELSHTWERTNDPVLRESVWREMLSIHAEQQYGIGILAEAPQPIVVSDRLRNVPQDAKWAWDPGAHFGIHRVDEFYYEDAFQQLTQ